MTIGTPEPHRGGYAIVEWIAWAIIAFDIFVLWLAWD